MEKVASVDGVVEMFPLVVTELASLVVDGVDTALSTHAVRTLDRRQAHQVDVDLQFGQLHRGRQTGQAAPDNHDSRFLRHHLVLARSPFPSPIRSWPARLCDALAGSSSPAATFARYILSSI